MRRLFVVVAVLALFVLPTAGASADPPENPNSANASPRLWTVCRGPPGSAYVPLCAGLGPSLVITHGVWSLTESDDLGGDVDEEASKLGLGRPFSR